ncbi:MAG: hypothetical protein AB1489_21215 [Acidobacteriota bacterium]
MRKLIEKYHDSVRFLLLVILLTLLCGLAWNLQANTTTTQRHRIPPGPRRGINYQRFSHTSHSPNCASCHQVKEGQRVTHLPNHPTCSNCHFFPAFTVGARSFCLICHMPPGNTARLKGFPEQRKDQFSIKFPHNIHVGLEVKDYDTPVPIHKLSEEQEKVQVIAEKNGCFSCHIKDGPKKKEASFSKPYHPECAQCHGSGGNKVAPAMNECKGCHQAPTPARKEIDNTVPNFRHDRDHERDIRPQAKSKATLDCKFCHSGAIKTKQLVDIQPPEVDKCNACHNDEVGAHKLTLEETAKLKQSAPKTDTPTTAKPPVKPLQPPRP